MLQKLRDIEKREVGNVGRLVMFSEFHCSYCDKLFIGNKDSYKRQDHCGCQRNKDKKSHGMTGTRPYRIWGGMKHRCEDITNPRYGGRGINYPYSWKTFGGFWKDMEEGYSDEYEIDRIDVNLGYYKENCQWITKKENIQKMHQDKNDYITYLENRIKELERRLENG